MRKSQFITIISLLVILTGSSELCHASEPIDNDSVVSTLDEIVVEGRTQRVIKNGVEYIPGKNMKKASSDALSLLFNMQVPQVKVSPDMSAITTLGGENYNLFIDYIPCSQEDILSLQPGDVLRVEVMEYPQDPRFNSAPHVINFIMRRYVWGGYTKLRLTGEALNYYLISGGLYNKFSYRNWTFDVAASGNGVWDDKFTRSLSETFHNLNYNGIRYDNISKLTETKDYSSRRNNQEVSLRGAFTYGNNYISHTLSFRRNATPYSNQTEEASYSNGILPSAPIHEENNSQNINFAATGYYQFVLPKNNYIMADWNFNHSGNRANSIYQLSALSPVVNNVSERSYSPSANIYYTKAFPRGNMLRTMLSSYATFFNTKYNGSSILDQKLVSSESMFFMEYMQNWEFGLSLYSRVGLSYVYGRLNGETIMSEVNPRLGLTLQYYLNSHNNFALQAFWANSKPQTTIANDAMIQNNELMWTKGNPDLKNIYGPLISLSYNLIPDNRWSFGASASYNMYKNCPIYIFETLPGYNGIVKTYSDDNTEHNVAGKVSVSVKLLRNSLMLSADGGIEHTRRTGCLPGRLTYLTGYAQAAYYTGGFNFVLFYSSPQKSILTKLGYSRRMPSAYGLMAGYTKSNFNINLSIRNIFNSGMVKERYESLLYTADISRRVSGCHKNISLTLTYTIPYGKHIDHNDDLKNNAVNQSAILE